MTPYVNDEINLQNRSLKTASFRQMAFVFILAVFLPVVAIYLSQNILSDSQWIMESFHSFFEIAGGCIAILLSLIIINFDFKNKAIQHIWIAYGLLCMGILDIMHTWVHAGNTFVWLHSMAVFTGGIFFLLVWLPIRQDKPELHRFFLGFLSMLLIAAGSVSILLPEIVPRMMLNNEFTWSANFLNMTGGLAFIVSAFYFISRFLSKHQFEDLLFINLCLLFGMAGILFQMSGLWDISWWFWHFLRMLAYIFVTGYMIVLIRRGNAEMKRIQSDLDQIFNYSIDGKLVISNAYEIIRANKIMLDMLDVDKSEIIGRKCYDLMKVRLCQTDLCPVRQIEKGNSQVDDEVIITNRNNQKIVTQFRSAPLFDENRSLKAIVESFIDITSQKEFENKINQQNIIKTGQSRLYEKMRSTLNPQQLSQVVIQFLSRYINAHQGAFYIFNKNKNYLTLTGGFALTQNNKKSEFIFMGQGIAGQVAQNREMLYVENIPDESMCIHSGLGHAMPRFIVALPLITDQLLCGVIELASLNAFSDTDIEFLQVCTQHIAVAVAAANDRQKMQGHIKSQKKS